MKAARASFHARAAPTSCVSPDHRRPPGMLSVLAAVKTPLTSTPSRRPFTEIGDIERQSRIAPSPSHHRAVTNSTYSSRAPSRLPPMIRLQMLGGFDLTVDGQRVAVPHGSQRLLALLALRRRRLQRVF